MLIDTIEQYGKIPNGSILYVVLVGDEWGEEVGKSVKCIKSGDKLYEIPKDDIPFYTFSERHDLIYHGDDLEFFVILNPEDAVND